MKIGPWCRHSWVVVQDGAMLYSAFDFLHYIAYMAGDD